MFVINAIESSELLSSKLIIVLGSNPLIHAIIKLATLSPRIMLIGTQLKTVGV